MSCLNKTSVEYEDLKRSSTLPEDILDKHCLSFFDKHNRMPRLDEIPGSNSTEYLKKELKVTKYNGIKNKDLFELTGVNTVPEATINLNNHYLDSQIDIVDCGESSIIKMQQRPNNLVKDITQLYDVSNNITNENIIQGLHTLRKLYGYDFKEISSFELEQEEWKDLMPSNKLVKAFIYNGNIYINTDNFSPDSRIHEMLHLLVGSIRFANPKLYTTLLKQASMIENIDQLAQQLHPDKTRNDALEEILVSELANKLSGRQSRLDKLTDEQLYEINYNVKRTLDTILYGDYSTKCISDQRLYGMSMKEVVKEVNSNSMTSTFNGTFNRDGSEVHRKLANKKAELLKNYELFEICG